MDELCADLAADIAPRAIQSPVFVVRRQDLIICREARGPGSADQAARPCLPRWLGSGNRQGHRPPREETRRAPPGSRRASRLPCVPGMPRAGARGRPAIVDTLQTPASDTRRTSPWLRKWIVGSRLNRCFMVQLRIGIDPEPAGAGVKIWIQRRLRIGAQARMHGRRLHDGISWGR